LQLYSISWFDASSCAWAMSYSDTWLRFHWQTCIPRRKKGGKTNEESSSIWSTHIWFWWRVGRWRLACVRLKTQIYLVNENYLIISPSSTWFEVNCHLYHSLYFLLLFKQWETFVISMKFLNILLESPKAQNHPPSWESRVA